MAKVIFNQSRKVDGKIYPKSKEPVELDDKHLKHWFVKEQIKAGDITVVAQPSESEEDSEEGKTPIASKSAKAAKAERAAKAG